MFFTAFVLCILRLFKLKTEGQIIYRKPHCKVTKFKSKFSLNLGYLNRALNNPTQELRFYAWLNLYISILLYDKIFCEYLWILLNIFFSIWFNRYAKLTWFFIDSVVLFWHFSGKNRKLMMSYARDFPCSVQLPSYGCTREVAMHERSVRVARGDSRVRLKLLECLANLLSTSITR